MHKKTLVAFVIAGVLIGGSAVFAQPASALSIDELQAQIKELLAKLDGLRAQLATQTQASSTASTAVSSSAPHRICAILNRNLGQGSRGDDVSGLQEFLQSEGYLSVNATGYFGSATAQAVAKWQSSQGLSSVGALGPMSRERIKVWCGNTGNLAARPTTGSAPLTVNFAADVTLTNPNLVADAGDYKIVFGDGSEQVFSCASSTGSCPGPHSASHTYSANGSYTATLVHYNYFGMPNQDGSAPSRVVGKVGIRVGNDTSSDTLRADPSSGLAPLAVKFAFNPRSDEDARYWIDFGDGNGQVMDVQQIYCIRAPCLSPSSASHTYTAAGSYTASVSRYIACLHSNPRCLVAEPPPLAQVSIAVRTSSSSNQPPVISGFSGPTTLSVGATGTWTIQASDPENQQLSYRITWGDEGRYPSASASLAAEAFVQTTTFTHSYASAGTYTVIIVVTDSSGAQAKSSSTVKVGSDGVACTLEYAPVCGRPSGCMNTCAPGMACPAICQLYPAQTFGNRCAMNAAGAQLIHEGACYSSNDL